MQMQQLLKQKNMSVYRLSKSSRVPYATCSDIVNGKARLEKCSAETVYKLAHALDIPMEELLAPCFVARSSFENFKSTVCHRLKEMGDIRFLLDILEKDTIRTYYNRQWYPECLYLLAMVDYLSRENGVSLCDSYDDLRKCRLDSPIYPAGVLAISAAGSETNILKSARQTAIPEFKRFNIIESDIRNVI